MNSDWLQIGPEAMYWAPRNAPKVWGIETIYITENGTSSKTSRGRRQGASISTVSAYLRNYLTQLHRATAEGVPVRGLLPVEPDGQFRVVVGFAKRFGLYHVDFQTRCATPKLSASFYREVVARNAVGP